MSDKLILYDFRCTSCTSVFDDMVKSDVFEAICPECGETGTRLVSRPRLDPRLGVDADGFPTMGDKWARTRVQRKKVEERREREHGPDSWGSAGADVIR